MIANTVKIAKSGPNAGWWVLRNALALGLPFTNSSGSFTGAPVEIGIFTGQLPPAEVAALVADRPTYVIRSYRTPIAWRAADGTWYSPAVQYSATTSQHQNKARTAIAALVGELPSVREAHRAVAALIATEDDDDYYGDADTANLGRYASNGAYARDLTAADLITRIDALIG
jgi:hypothetical protein